MDFTLEELRSTLAEMGLENIPESHLKHFAKDLKHLMKHEKHVQKRIIKSVDPVAQTPRPIPSQQPYTKFTSTTGLPINNTATFMKPNVTTNVNPATFNKSNIAMSARPATCSYTSHQFANFDRTNYNKSESESADKKVNPVAVSAAKQSKSATTTRKSEKEKAKLEEAKWKKLKTDPVRLYGWYKTHWDFHGLE